MAEIFKIPDGHKNSHHNNSLQCLANSVNILPWLQYPELIQYSCQDGCQNQEYISHISVIVQPGYFFLSEVC